MHSAYLANNDSVIDIGVEQLEHFHCVLAYHTLLHDGAIALRPFRVGSVDGPNLGHVIQGPNICYILIHADQFISSMVEVLIIDETTIPLYFLLYTKPNALYCTEY